MHGRTISAYPEIAISCRIFCIVSCAPAQVPAVSWPGLGQTGINGTLSTVADQRPEVSIKAQWSATTCNNHIHKAKGANPRAQWSAKIGTITFTHSINTLTRIHGMSGPDGSEEFANPPGPPSVLEPSRAPGWSIQTKVCGKFRGARDVADRRPEVSIKAHRRP